jgi:Na+-transporting methylmalonyl-CoA/oxaloacetate decarboxylase gamma subunit
VLTFEEKERYFRRLGYLQRMFSVFLGLGFVGVAIVFLALSPLVFVFIEIWTFFIDCKRTIKEICAECAAPNNGKN